MGYNATAKQRAATASHEERVKRSLETPADNEMTRVFNDMARKSEKHYAKTGSILNLEEFKPDVVKVLNAVYKRSFTAFSTGMADYIYDHQDSKRDPLVIAFAGGAEADGHTVEQELKIVEKEMKVAYAETQRRWVNRSSDEIIDTSQKDLNTATKNAIEELNNEAAKALIVKSTLAQVARQAAANFKVYFPFRASLIATTEVGTSAEATKGIEADSIDAVVKRYSAGIVGGAVLISIKEWHTMGDGRVRPAHRAADLQRAKADEPFHVGGERLMQPHDRSLGASAGNTCNCRCTAIYYHGDDQDIL